LTGWFGSSLPVWSLIIGGIIAIIIRETFIEGGGKGDTIWVIWIVSWWVSNIFWDSSDHHGDGDIVVVGSIFLLISISFSNGVEGVITNNLSETFEGNRLDVIEIVGWANVKGDSFDLIDWDIDVLGPFLPFSGILSFGGEEVIGSWSGFAGNLGLSLDWSSGWNHSNTDVFGSSWFLSVFLVVLFVVLVMMFRALLHEVKVISFFKVSFLTFIAVCAFLHHISDVVLNQTMDLAIS